MKYISTRNNAPTLDFAQATLTGLAADGGLYLPALWPKISAAEMGELHQLNYAQLAARILAKFGGGCLSDDEWQKLCAQVYCEEVFAHAEIAPLKLLSPSIHLLELFHGPTLAFKDFALQLLGKLFAHFLAQTGQRCTIIGATSGDTGSAAIEAVRGVDAVVLYMLHPRGRVSEVQRRQMTTVTAANIHNLAIDGDFDDCQNIVKGLFNDAAFRARHRLAAVNSINWARIAAQIAYYFYAYFNVVQQTSAGASSGGDARAVNFAVPTGNFGNVFAGFAAREMGLPIARLIIGSNRNDSLTRFFETGRMTRGELTPTISPSMDIQISSNFERYLFELSNRDGARVGELMADYRKRGEFAVSRDAHNRARKLFYARRFSDEQTRAEMKRVYEECGELIDPHSAIGIAAARAFEHEHGHDHGHGNGNDTPTIALATAHPAKFNDAVEAACGATASLPEFLSDLMTREEKMECVANDLAAVKAVIDARAG